MDGWQARLEDVKEEEILWKMHGRKDIRWIRDTPESQFTNEMIATDQYIHTRDGARLDLLREKMGMRKTVLPGKWIGTRGVGIRVSELLRVRFGGIVSYCCGRVWFARCDVVMSSVGRSRVFSPRKRETKNVSRVCFCI